MKADKICRTAYFANAKQFSEKSSRKYPKDVGKLCKHVLDESAETPKTKKTKTTFDFFLEGLNKRKIKSTQN